MELLLFSVKLFRDEIYCEIILHKACVVLMIIKEIELYQIPLANEIVNNYSQRYLL